MSDKFSAISSKIIQISFLFQVLWQKESVSPLIFQRISELEVRINLLVCGNADAILIDVK